MSKIEFDMPKLKDIPEKWKEFAEEAGIPALIVLADKRGGTEQHIPAVNYFLPKNTKKPTPPIDTV